MNKSGTKGSKNRPTRSIAEFSEAAKNIEEWAKKASEEITKGSLLGYFYITITLILVSIFAILSVAFIIWVGLFFPPEYRWIVTIISSLPVIAVIYFFIKSMNN